MTKSQISAGGVVGGEAFHFSKLPVVLHFTPPPSTGASHNSTQTLSPFCRLSSCFFLVHCVCQHTHDNEEWCQFLSRPLKRSTLIAAQQDELHVGTWYARSRRSSSCKVTPFTQSAQSISEPITNLSLHSDRKSVTH